MLSDELDNLFDFDMSAFGVDDDEEEEQHEPERTDLSNQVGEMYQIIIDCQSELEQEELFYKLTEEGLKCRTLIL